MPFLALYPTHWGLHSSWLVSVTQPWCLRSLWLLQQAVPPPCTSYTVSSSTIVAAPTLASVTLRNCPVSVAFKRTSTKFASDPLEFSPTGCKLNRLNAAVGEYAKACLQVARDCGTDVLDLWTLMQKDNQVPWFSQSSQGYWDHTSIQDVCSFLD